MPNSNEKYFRSELIPELVDRFENMIEKKTQYYFDISEFENLIDFYIDDSDTEKASEVIQFACKQHPGSSLLSLKHGQVLLDNGMLKEALQLSKKIEKIEPTEPEIYILQANCYLNSNKIELADESFKKAIENTHSELDEAYHDIAYFYLNAEKFDLSLKYLKKAIKINPKNYAAIFDFAYINFTLADYTESIKWYKIYLEKHPFSAKAWNNIGDAYASLKEKELAIKSFDYSISIEKDFSIPYFAKGQIYFDTQEYHKAINTYLTLLSNNKANDGVYFLIADCYQQLNDYKNALEYYKKSINISPLFADSWHSIASILFDLKKYSSAKKFVEKAIKLDDTESEFWYLLAKISSKLGTFQKTSSNFHKAIELDTNNIDVWISYSEYCYQNGFIESSIEILEKASLINENNAYLHYLLSGFYTINKESKLANYNFQMAIHLDYNFHKKFFLHFPEAKKNKLFQKIVKALKSK